MTSGHLRGERLPSDTHVEPPDRPNTIASRLTGTWALDSYVEIDATRRQSRPLGFSPSGRIMYDPEGHMSVLIAHSPRTDGRPGRLEIAYAGEYTVDEDELEVRHRVESSLDPTWVGGCQRRRIRFPTPDTLTLTTIGSIETRRGLVGAILSWRRPPITGTGALTAPRRS